LQVKNLLCTALYLARLAVFASHTKPFWPLHSTSTCRMPFDILGNSGWLGGKFIPCSMCYAFLKYQPLRSFTCFSPGCKFTQELILIMISICLWLKTACWEIYSWIWTCSWSWLSSSYHSWQFSKTLCILCWCTTHILDEPIWWKACHSNNCIHSKWNQSVLRLVSKLV
jgi:hypothetical protein